MDPGLLGGYIQYGDDDPQRVLDVDDDPQHVLDGDGYPQCDPDGDPECDPDGDVDMHELPDKETEATTGSSVFFY